MSIGQIVVLTAVVGAFVVFATVLGWGDYRAQQLTGARDRKDAAVPKALQKADRGAAATPATAQARWPQPANDRLRHVA